MKKSTFFTLAAAALLAGTSAVQASTDLALPHVKPELVTPLDTFSFDVVVFNNTANVAAYAVSPIDTTFGTTTTYTGAGLGSTNVTITSSETVGITTTTDTFTVSTPSNFAPTGYTIGGTAIQGVEFDIDQDTTFADPVNLAVAIPSDTTTGNTIYNTSTNLALTPVVTLLNSGAAYQAYVGVGVASGSINSLKVHSFTINVTYPTLAIVPEPSTYAAAAVGALALGTVLLRRNRRKASL